MRALFLGAHPDDVEVSAGGTIARLVGEGWCVVIGLAPHGIEFVFDQRFKEATAAAALLGAKLAWFPWTDLRNAVEHFGSDYWYSKDEGPFDLIVTPSPSDSHQEHRNVAELGIALARKNKTDLWHMNHAIPGGLANPPRLNHYVTFNREQSDQKQRAIREHESQIQKYGQQWLTTISYRDSLLGGLVGHDWYAEGFEIAFSRQ